ncbi:MAG: 6,7-dimethyl-8-ribityllumazine synthase [Bacteroidetes bacterium]|nr:6,7-dimethyl-8-ribityllumazine synthase [Bacteroidota bacterium]
MDFSQKKIGIVISKYNEPIIMALLKGAKSALIQKGFDEKNIDVFFVPGAYEIPLIVKKLCNLTKYDGIVTLGCVIKGETAHFEYICEPLSHTLMNLSVEFEIPVGFGVLTTLTPQQAYERSLEGKDNKGYEAASAVIEILELSETIS